MSLRICCIDDNRLCKLGIQQAISETNHQIIAELPKLESLSDHLNQHPSDVLIAEIRVAGIDTIEYFDEQLQAFPNTKVIVYTYDENPTHVARASILDAWEYVSKRSPVRRLIDTLDALTKQERPKNSIVDQAKIFLKMYHKSAENLTIPLTKQEHRILVHISLGLSNREISKSLNISLETVKEHVQNVLRKLQASDRTAAAIWALKNGIPTLNLKFDDPAP
jgi:DNA-binding NarL/FixJ family response regulator